MDDTERAAAAIATAKALLLTAGAGMGVDSGLPDFRGDEGFYGHRLELYRRTEPHRGFHVLRRLAARAGSFFVFTSNVDGQFQRAGFPEDAVHECHGSIHHFQCLAGCGVGIFPATGSVTVDPTTCRARPPLPSCPACGALARPNILMFGDWGWDDARSADQGQRFQQFLETAPRGTCVIECGAGSAIPTVRRTSESAARSLGGTLVRLNVREPETPPGHLGLRMGALEALTRIDALVAS